MSEERKETKNNAKNNVEEILKRIDEGEDRVLNQNEIDTLLTAIASDEEFKPVNRTRKIKIYDFERPDKFSKEDLRDISNVSETIARELTKLFASKYEIFPKFHVASVDQLTCEEFLRSIPMPTPCMNFSWMDSEGIFELDREVFFDGFMGAHLEKARDLNGLEKNLFTRDIYSPIEEIIYREFSTKADKKLPEITEQEFVDNPQFLIKHNSFSEMGLLVVFEVSLNNVEKQMNLFLTDDLVKALRENGFFSERKFFQKKGEIIIPLTYPEPDTIIEVGRFRLEENFKIKKNMIFESNKLAGDALDIYKDGKQVALGEGVVIDDNRGVRVTENVETPEEETFYNTKIIYGGCSTEAEEKFGEGRILELREWWNEPAKVIKDNKVIAYGEILVIDESFGVKITEVVE